MPDTITTTTNPSAPKGSVTSTAAPLSPASTKSEGDVQVTSQQDVSTATTIPANKTISTTSFVFMAMGGSIGAGLFVASGTGLVKGGPLSVVLAFLVVGIAVFLTMCALGELMANYSAEGSFYGYIVRFINPSWGFAMGWTYVLNYLLIVSFEICVMVFLAQFFLSYSSSMELSLLESKLIGIVPAAILVLMLCQAYGARWYGVAEMGFGIGKVAILMLSVILGIVVASGGTLQAGGRGFENYMHGQAFRNGVPGFISVLSAAAMAYGGTEMLGLTALETAQPARVMPLGAMIVAARIIGCYILPLFIVGLVVHPSAFLSPAYKGLHVVSPFVVAANEAGLPKLALFINAFLILGILSMANASVFASSRATAAICQKGMGPEWLGRLTMHGTPRNALMVVFATTPLAFLIAYNRGQMIFDWLLALASQNNVLIWLSINVAYIRCRRALEKQGRTTADLKWKSPFGVYGSYVASFIIAASTVAQVVSAVLPSVVPTEATRIELVIQGILGLAVTAVVFGGHLVYTSVRGGLTWAQRLWIPVDQLALPELEEPGPLAQPSRGVEA